MEDHRKIAGPNSCQVKPHSKPWMARMNLDGFGHYCGGVLIGTRFVLTAAHCICWTGQIGRNCTGWKYMTVILGDHDLKSDLTATKIPPESKKVSEQQEIKIEYAEPFGKWNGKCSDISKILATSRTFKTCFISNIVLFCS